MAARRAALAGQFEIARQFALALTQADPDDRAALIVLAAVQPQLGEARLGRTAGARAYRLSNTDTQRYEAARLTALAAANEERYTLSQIWLRRAAVNAPSDEAYAQTQNDYRGIRNLNPWSVQLGFSITPSDNVNGGSDSEFNIIDGFTLPDGTPVIGVLSGAAQALPGVAAVADLRLSYGLSRTNSQRTTLTARAYNRSVFLNSEARAISPTSRNSDFASQRVELSVEHTRSLGDGALTVEGLVGASWFAREQSSDYLRARLRYALPVSDRTQVTVSGVFDEINLATRTNHQRGLTAAVVHLGENSNRFTASLTVTEQASPQDNESYQTISAQLGYAWGEQIGPAQLSVTAGMSHTDYPIYAIPFPVAGGRQDTRIYGSLSAVFPDVGYAGFVPVVTFGAQDTTSNVSRFERNEYSINIGIRSSF